VLPNISQAQTQDGSYSYRMKMVNINPETTGLNGYKVRSDGTISIPQGTAFNYLSPPRAPLDFETLFPNIDIDDLACADFNRPGIFCDPLTDPSCCLNPTLYTGEWRFCFMVPDGLETLDIWDGDFDFGSASFDNNDNCLSPDNIDVDTDDQNTPIPLPEWALNTDAITQSASIPTNPSDDDGCNPLSNRPPSVIYDLVSPEGDRYLNSNPSGNIEWELFNITILPFDPDLYDLQVDNIPGGLWCVETTGNNMQNLNSLRLPFAVIGVDDEGDPVIEPPLAMEVPTLNQWGFVVLAAIIGILGIMRVIRKRKAAA
ncbi:MAG: IPTL-CTERM sorting domain-containing protein, partial [Thermodesulfobacteriota bacterium]